MAQHEHQSQDYHEAPGFISLLPWMLIPLIPTLVFIVWFFADHKILV